MKWTTNMELLEDIGMMDFYIARVPLEIAYTHPSGEEVRGTRNANETVPRNVYRWRPIERTAVKRSLYTEKEFKALLKQRAAQKR